MKKIKQQETLGRQARIGLHFLKNAVLEILLVSQNDGPLQHEEIRERLGITAPGEPHKKATSSSITLFSISKVKDVFTMLLITDMDGRSPKQKHQDLKRHYLI